MNPRMRDYMINRDRRMMRDERNPYGSRGGYVSSRPDRRDERDYRGYSDNRDYARNNYYEGEFRGTSEQRDSRYDNRNRYDYGDYNYYPMNDYGYNDYGGGYLSERELKEWKYRLASEMEKGEPEMFSDEKIIKRARDMGVKFDNYTEEELAVTTLMMFSDYGKTLGKANIDMYIKLANDFLCDKDSKVKYGEKLAMYFDCFANV